MSFLEIEDLRVEFQVDRGFFASDALVAVNDLSLCVEKGESVGVVGESGCGKSTLANAILGLVPRTAGSVRLEGCGDIEKLQGSDLSAFRRKAQMIFQDPYASLNPRMTIGSALREVLQVHGLEKGDAQDGRIAELLESVGLDESYRDRYPHEFSGGQRQRIGIARALAVSPSLVIADEPVSALDVSVQVQILNLMKTLQQQLGLTYLFIAHDLAVVRYVCDRIVVMYLGRIVEEAPAEELFANPRHPYTKALIAAVPDVEAGLAARTEGRRSRALTGDAPSPLDHIEGCAFHPRCPYAEDRCRAEVPSPLNVGEMHTAACHFAKEGLSSAREEALS